MRTEIFWIAGRWPGRLAISPRPRGGDWLQDEVREWHDAGVATVVSLLTGDEIEELELSAEPSLCEAQSVELLSLPIPDRGLPESRERFEALVLELERRLSAGKSVLVHCRQGIGRSSMLAAALLNNAGEGVDPALARIGSARGRPVPDTEEQRQWLHALE
ncbi:MAG: dual specificity protein phosphatase family protein [Deltaproteobacteria bacterium]|nr:dual specificity protein phosphatase family protein [Deltaproteobacteria bacterium]